MANSKKTVLIISPSEIYHNPRLIKAAEEFYKSSFEVVIWNIIIGNIEKHQYENFISKKPWQVLSFDISRNTFRSKINLILCSILNKVSILLWNKFQNKIGYNYYMSKGLLGFKIDFKPDIVYTNVIDTLPFSYQLAKKHNAMFCFDSQELFSGQYQNAGHLYEWVKKSESEYMTKADLVLSTTHIMGEQIKKKYPTINQVVMVRNLPNKLEKIKPKVIGEVLKLIWHGYSIYLHSRGVNLLLDALKLCKTNVTLTLQGKISATEKDKINIYLGANFRHLLQFQEAASVGKIVKSIMLYDIGLLGEQPENPNQLYTSSNKLFDYLHAGLPVISTATPGLVETIQPYEVGVLYEKAKELAEKIDFLNLNRVEYSRLSFNAIMFAKSNLWSTDFSTVIKILK